ncbi:FecR domain-containing protein, partial [bacterium]|nr:FecR domain-containing protein [bacterium]
MKCHNLESYLADYLEGELDAAREAELLAHVEECPVCRAEFEAHRELDERLGRFFALEREKAEAVANPLPEEAAARRVTPVYARPWALAVAAILVAVIGFAGWWAYRHSVPTGDMPLATLAQAEGAVLLKDGDGYRAIAPGHVLLQNDKIKVGAKGYAAFGLPGGNTLEVRGGTQLRLADFPDRFEVQMDRGQVWAHLPERPEKRFVIQTAHLKAIATGTVYGVAEGIGRSEVQVAEGTVVIESNGAREEVEAGENFSSGDTTGEDRTDWLSWSRFSAQLVELLPALPDDTGTRPLRTVSTASASALTATSAAVDPVDYLSTDTWMFAEVADWGEIVREFTATDYSALLREPTVRDWWEAVGARKAFDELLSQREVKNFHEIVKLLDGPMAWGIRDDGEFVIIASLGPNESQVRFLIDNMFAPEPVETLDPVEAETRRLWEEAGIEPGEPTR